MAKRLEFSTKKLELDKSNTQMVIVVAVASFISIFCLIAAQGFLSQNNYNAKVIDAKAKTNDRLKDNIKAASKLTQSYAKFVKANPNVLGGDSTSNTADNGGDNARLVLDALPSTYDFPALTSSIEKLAENGNLKLTSITGTDDEVAQQTNDSSPAPVPVAMPFTFTVSNASYSSVQQLMNTLDSSIRPIQLDAFTLTGASDNMQITINAHTYYQPAKNLNITKKDVK
ncbi:MAG: uncharacterized protein JWN38_121 [Candidatus Saccharibacteria bacterium]|nr:uncharacterized protein [Candidatus Saccharibacteria bacterium]